MIVAALSLLPLTSEANASPSPGKCIGDDLKMIASTAAAMGAINNAAGGGEAQITYYCPKSSKAGEGGPTTQYNSKTNPESVRTVEDIANAVNGRNGGGSKGGSDDGFRPITLAATRKGDFANACNDKDKNANNRCILEMTLEGFDEAFPSYKQMRDGACAKCARQGKACRLRANQFIGIVEDSGANSAFPASSGGKKFDLATNNAKYCDADPINKNKDKNQPITKAKWTRLPSQNSRNMNVSDYACAD